MATAAAINELGSYAHNPRGNLWFNDDSSYGQKLLLKMGWRKGKGLGKKEDGIKENLKVKFKNTNSGLGYKDVSYANVMKTEYDSILKSLSAEYPKEKIINGCNKNELHENKDFKQKSRVVKSKIRYPKLYYGKDVSKYSEEDMKSIFICSLPAKNNEQEKSENSEICLEKESENQLPTVQETFTSHLSVSDYFNLKMKEKKDNEQRKKCSSKVKRETDCGCNKEDYQIKQEKTSFKSNKTNNEKEQEKYDIWSNKIGYKTDQENIDFTYQIIENLVLQPSITKCKKQKINEVSVNGVDKELLSGVQKEMEDAITPDKKQKELSKNSVHEDLSVEKMCKISNFVGDHFSSSSKKRKRSHKNENHSISTVIQALSSYQPDPQFDLMPSKKRKKLPKNEKYEISANSALVNNFSDEGLMEIAGESLSSINNNNSPKKKKKLKSKLNPLKKLKSCLKSKSNVYAVKNVSFNENISYKMIDSENESTGVLSDCKEKLQKDFEILSSNVSLEKNSADSQDNEAKDSSKQNRTHYFHPLPIKIPTSYICLEKHSANCKDKEVQDRNTQNEIHYSDPLATSSNEDNCISLSSLPSSNSSHYNSWVESQKLALKMKLYKNLLKGIKKHEILKTTNLSTIKGYGCWGF